MLLRFALLLLLLALGAGGLAADPAWRPTQLSRADPKELADLQSPLHACERRLADGGTLTIGGERFTLASTGEPGRASWTRLDADSKKDKRTRTGTLRVPGSTRLGTAIDGPYTVHVRVEQGGFVVQSRTGLRVPAGKALGFLVDCDLDGAFGGPGDGYVAPESRTVGPWRYRWDASGGWERSPIELPHPADRDHSAAWCLLQWRRQQCGCLPLGYDHTLEDGMRKHAEYLARNGGEAHEEQPGKPGYTPEGARAASGCIIGHGDSSSYSAVEMHLATMYHRTRPLQPGLERTAMVFHKGRFLFDVFTHRGGPYEDALLVYPPHGMQGVRTTFHEQGESPMPVSGVKADGNGLGTAVNVFSEPLRTATSLPERPTLMLVSTKRRKAPVAGHFHFPGEPPGARAGASNRGNVVLVPKRALRPRTRYAASTRIVLPGGTSFVYRWWFETAKDR